MDTIVEGATPVPGTFACVIIICCGNTCSMDVTKKHPGQ